MKRLFVILLCNICIYSYAQTVEKNLKLVGMVTRDTVINLSGSGSSAEFQYKVPEGRVWKVENLSIGYDNYYGVNPRFEIKINSILVISGIVNQYSPYIKDFLPLWLNSGDILKITNYFQNNNPLNFRLAGFEFMME